MNAYWVDVLNQALILSIFVVSLNVLMGFAGQLSVAHVALGAVGGFVAAWLSLRHGWGFLPGLAAGVLASALAGAALGVLALRLGTDSLVLMTLAFATVVVALIVNVPGFGGAFGLQGFEPATWAGEDLVRPNDLFKLVLVVVVVTFAISWRMAHSPFGRVLKGIREDEVATRGLGKDVFRFKITTFVVTAGLSGAGAVLLVYYNQFASAPQFNFTVTTTVVAAVVIGGAGNLFGSLVGAALLAFLNPILQKVINLDVEKSALWAPIIFGTILIVVMRLRPAGIVPEGASLRRLLRRRGPSLPVITPTPTPVLATAAVTAPAELAVAGVQTATAAHGVTAEVPAATEIVPPPVRHADLPVGVEYVLEARGLVKHFGGIRAVQGLDLALPQGRITALIGPNGAGKTTVFNLLTGAIAPDAGQVLLRGEDITGTRPDRATALGIGRSYQDVRLFARISVWENVALAVPGQRGEQLPSLFARPRALRADARHTKEVVEESLAYVGLAGRGNDLAGQLAYGDQKLVAIARLLATGGDVLLIDEPASGIDRAALDPVLEVLERLRDEGRTICLVEHNLDVVARLADNVVFMEEGRMTAEGTMDDIAGDERLAKVYFGHG